MIKLLSSVLILSTVLLSACSTQTHVTQAINSANTSTQNNTPDAKIGYAFTQAKQHPEKLLENVINSSQKTLDIAIYSLTKSDIIDAILNAKQRGVNVRVITDRIEAHNKYQSQDLQKLIQAGIPVKENHHSGLMHLKVTIADKSVLTVGSYNYTKAASTTNDEVILIVHDTNMASDWDKEFDTMWNDNVNYEDVK